MIWPSPVLLDTDLLSAVMRGHPMAIAKGNAYLIEHNQFTFSAVTRFELLRGLKVKGATRQAADFEKLCAANIVLDITDSIIVKAADIYASLHRSGLLIGDADILIGAKLLFTGMESPQTTNATSGASPVYRWKTGLSNGRARKNIFW